MLDVTVLFLGKIMRKETFLISLVLAINGSAAIAATPVFQLKEDAQGAGVMQRVLASDAYPSDLRHDAPSKMLRMSSSPSAAPMASAPPVIFSAVEDPGEAWSDAEIVAAAYAPGAGGRAVETNASGLNASRDALFHFLKHFKARPIQKPARWTMLLAGACFVLYQLRRRPMRTSIGGLLYGSLKFSRRQGA
jgi:hypothetical protein